MNLKKQVIGIIGAMREEITPLLEYYKEYETISYANNEFYKINFNDNIIIIVQSKIGKVFSSITSSILIEKFKVDKVLFTGVAGGISKDLKIGDLMYASSVCQHDFDITAFGHKPGYIPDAGIFIDADYNLISIAKKVANELDINLKKGIIATGDQFISSNEKRDFIVKNFNASAIEMEGAAVGFTCNTLNIPFFILRSISDTANDEANINFDEFVKVAAVNSANFIMKMVERLLK